MRFSTYQQTINYFHSFITDRRSLKFSGQNGVERTKYLLRLLGNPQEKTCVVHIAGTSGKGSTAYLINRLLQQHGFKVGLQVSPHLVDIRERFQINNQLISKKLFIETFREIRSTIEKAKESRWGKLTFFEILVAFTFYIFWKHKVDYAVMETGLGGLYDGTNVVENEDKLVILTKIGLDHQWILGKTYEKIASQKAGIIKKNNVVITLKQKKSVDRVFKKTAKDQRATLYRLKAGKNYQNLKISGQATVFDFYFHKLIIKQVQLGLIGRHQVENCSLALAGFYLLSKKYQFKTDVNRIREVLKTASFPGRFQIFKANSWQVIVDGAHNPQKMRVLTRVLKEIYHGQQFNFLIAFSRSKDQIPTMRNMLNYLVPLAKKIFITNFVLTGQDSLHRSVDQKKIIDLLKQLNFDRYQIVSNNKKTINRLIKKRKNHFIITGSLYFISSIYKELNNNLQ